MKRMQLTGIALLLMTGIPVISMAQDKVEADIGADLVSGYIWRGQDLGNVSIQPSASVSYKGFSLSGWGSVGLDKEDTKEFDLTLGYSSGGFSVSVTDYWFDGGPEYFHYGAHNTSHVFEAQVGYDFGPLAVNWYTNFAGADGVKANGNRAYSSYFSIAAPFKLGGLDWSAEIGLLHGKPASITMGQADLKFQIYASEPARKSKSQIPTRCLYLPRLFGIRPQKELTLCLA